MAEKVTDFLKGDPKVIPEKFKPVPTLFRAFYMLNRFGYGGMLDELFAEQLKHKDYSPQRSVWDPSHVIGAPADPRIGGAHHAVAGTPKECLGESWNFRSKYSLNITAVTCPDGDRSLSFSFDGGSPHLVRLESGKITQPSALPKFDSKAAPSVAEAFKAAPEELAYVKSRLSLP